MSKPIEPHPVEHYVNLFNTMQELPYWKERIDENVDLIIKHRGTYELAVEETNIPWYMIAVIHSMESSCDFRCQIANGERWTRKTKEVPEGWGPWASWIDSTKWIIANDNKFKIIKSQSSIGVFLRMLEMYNGLGYKRHGKNSTYLWSGSNHGIDTGKYTSDGVYNPNAISQQVGAAVLLGRLLNDTYPPKRIGEVE